MKLFLTATFVMLVITTFSQKLSDFKKEESWYDFKNSQSQRLKLSEFSKNYKAELALTGEEQLIEKRNEKDNIGRTHIFYKHQINGIDVEYSELILHSGIDNNYVEIMNDKLTKKITKETIRLSEAQALKQALILFPSSKYAWQDVKVEAMLKEETHNPAASHFPMGKLVYAKEKFKEQTNGNYKLCYKFTIHSLTPFFEKDVYIDAVNGKVFKEIDLVVTCNDAATATTLYNGSQQIITDWKGWPWDRYILIDCANRNIHTKYGSDGNPEADNSSTTWGTNHQVPTSAHWAAEMTWDMYRLVYARNGTNNANREVKILVDYPGVEFINNAAWSLSGGNNDKIRVGRTGTEDNSLATLDIIGHEITHGVTHATSGLIYENQSGALNESFSDIFGLMVERRAQGGTLFDWRIGEDAFTTAGGIRDLISPNLFSQPSIVGGTFWFTGTADNGGVHINSGVPNRWFSILSLGGTQNGVTVTGIGLDDAARIAYNTLTVYLGQNSNFNDARNASITAALALFGPCSNQVIAVTNAWAAVGVGAAANPNCITLSPDRIQLCSDLPGQEANFPIVITPNIAPSTGTVTWDVPVGFGFVYYTNGNQLVITAGPMDDRTEYIGATLTSSQGNPATAFFTYIVQQCNYYEYAVSQNRNKNSIIEKEATDETQIKIFPNPASNVLNIITSELGIVTINDLTGRQVFKKELKSKNNNFDITTLNAGLYVITISTANKIYSKKIVIEHSK